MVVWRCLMWSDNRELSFSMPHLLQYIIHWKSKGCHLCILENQKGVITVWSLYRVNALLVLKGTEISPFWFSMTLSAESQKGVKHCLKMFPWEAGSWALSLHNVYGDNTLLALNGTLLNSVHALSCYQQLKKRRVLTLYQVSPKSGTAYFQYLMS